MKYKVKVDNKMAYFGDTDTSKKLIRINKKKAKETKQKGELLDTIYHEVAHSNHPRMKEKTIQKLTERNTKYASKKTKAKLYAKAQKSKSKR